MLLGLLRISLCGTLGCTAEILALPVRNSKEDCNDESRDQLQVVGVQAEIEDHLNNQIVHNRTEREKYYASFRPLEYYCDIENSYDVIYLENCIPAGTTISIPYYFSGYELSGHTLSVMPLSDDEITKSNSFKLTVP